MKRSSRHFYSFSLSLLHLLALKSLAPMRSLARPPTATNIPSSPFRRPAFSRAELSAQQCTLRRSLPQRSFPSTSSGNDRSFSSVSLEDSLPLYAHAVGSSTLYACAEPTMKTTKAMKATRS